MDLVSSSGFLPMGNKQSSVFRTKTGIFNHRGAYILRNNQVSLHYSRLSTKALLNHREASGVGAVASLMRSSGLLTKNGAILNHGGAEFTMGTNQSSVQYSCLSTKTGYDVFLNHRGPDVKESIGSLIFHNLQNKGFKVFFDKNSIRAGENVPRSIEEVIHSSSAHIAIFSPNYVQSVWYLRELQLILKTGADVIPVFCGIQPCELRMKDNQGVFARTFHKHTGRFERHVLEEWKKALSLVSFIKGFIFEGDQGELLSKLRSL